MSRADSSEVPFKQVLGRTIFSEISRIRMNHAREFLTQTDLSIQSIAKQSGFSSASYFAYAFKQEHNISPYTYRKESRI